MTKEAEYYQSLFKSLIKDYIKADKAHSKILALTLSNQIDVHCLEGNSTYVVQFDKGVTPDTISNVMQILNKHGEQNNIKFIPSCSLWRIGGKESLEVEEK